MSSRVSADWNPMDDMVALVSCGGKWVPASPQQLELITMGEDACACQQMPVDYTTEVRGEYEYVIRAGGNTRYLKNVYTGKCREVLVVCQPTVWEEPINHPPRGF